MSAYETVYNRKAKHGYSQNDALDKVTQNGYPRQTWKKSMSRAHFTNSETNEKNTRNLMEEIMPMFKHDYGILY